MTVPQPQVKQETDSSIPDVMMLTVCVLVVLVFATVAAVIFRGLLTHDAPEDETAPEDEGPAPADDEDEGE